MNPSDLKNIYPSASVLRKSEAETVAQNIMKILARTGDIWRELTLHEYQKERAVDGNFSQSENQYFEKSVRYTTSFGAAVLFSRKWYVKETKRPFSSITKEECIEVAKILKPDIIIDDDLGSMRSKTWYGIMPSCRTVDFYFHFAPFEIDVYDIDKRRSRKIQIPDFIKVLNYLNSVGIYFKEQS